MLIGRWVKLLTHDWSSGCLATASTFSVTMVSCFKIVENENAKNSTEYWKNGFEKWANESNFQANLEEYESDVLDQTLSQFYAFRNSVILPPMLLTSNHPMRLPIGVVEAIGHFRTYFCLYFKASQSGKSLL